MPDTKTTNAVVAKATAESKDAKNEAKAFALQMRALMLKRIHEMTRQNLGI